MRIWITRAEPEAEATAQRLRALGHEPVLAPLLEVQPIGAAPSLDGVGALAFTSRNGVRAFAAHSPARGLPVFAVGDATAGEARNAGFADVASASGDVAALAELIAARKDALKGQVLYLAPEEPAGDLIADLVDRGVAARAEVVYRTAPVEISAIPAEIDALLVHSPKAARRLAGTPAVEAAAPSLAVICISAAAAEPLQGLGFAEVLVSPAPNEAALIQRLDAWALTRKPIRLFPPLFWFVIAFALVCIVAAMLVASVGPHLFPPTATHPAGATAQPLQIRGKSG